MLENILKTCNYVKENSKYATINYENIEKLKEELKRIKTTHYLTKSPFDIMKLNIEEIINFLLLYESIDFSFWGNPKWNIMSDDNQLDGAYALLYVMLKIFKCNKNIFNYFENIEYEDFKKNFDSNVELPLLKERYKIIKSVSQKVNKDMEGNFYGYVKNMNTDTELFNFIIENFKEFKDERAYNNKKIYFYKLAQLLTSDILHIKEYKENTKVSYNNLLGCADYKIPQVLNNLNILNYKEELEQIITNKQIILENSIYEVEIRANTIAVIDYIYNMLDKKVSRIDINDFIWLKGQEKLSSNKPYHLTRTTSY